MEVHNMTKHINDTDTNLVAVAGIQNVTLIPGKGVIGLNNQRKPVIWIEETDEAAGIAIRDALSEVVRTKGRCGQPDWSKLTSKGRKAAKSDSRLKKVDPTNVADIASSNT